MYGRTSHAEDIDRKPGKSVVACLTFRYLPLK
jgi:hypothetical protein